MGPSTYRDSILVSDVKCRLRMYPRDEKSEMEFEEVPASAGQRLAMGSRVEEEVPMTPFSTLTNEQINALLVEHPKMTHVPGVVLVWVDFLGSLGTEVAVVATVYAGSRHDISQLPVSVAGVPVVVKVEDRRTGRILELIDPRDSGGTWPETDGAH